LRLIQLVGRLDFCLYFCFTVILVIQNYKWPFQIFFLQRMLGAFHSMKHSGLNLREFLMTNGTTGFRNFRKRGQPRDIYPNFRTFLSKNFAFLFIFLPEFPPGISKNLYINEIIEFKNKNVDSPLCYFCEKSVSLTRAVFAGDL